MDASHLSSFGAGIFAGATGIMLGHPLDTLKVRLQTGQKLPSDLRGAKLVRELYRGIIPPVTTAGAIQSLLFSSYEMAKRHGKSHFQLDHLSAVVYGGVISGSMISVITSPIGIVKIQQQINSRLGMIACAKHLAKTNGWRGFYRAYGVTLFMESYGRGVYLGIYEYSKLALQRNSTFRDIFYNGEPLQEIQQHHLADPHSGLPERMISAALAGMLSWLAVYPMDVIKSKLQSDLNKERYLGISDCAIKTYRESGLRGLFRGITFTLIRAAPVAATILPIYEMTRDFLHHKLNEIGVY